ncbi:hypothetical protein [Streptomyces sp. HC307]|uniref:hypothetical protein n=1 Tax=Streptomyces flavusporus TaxID=3385496 RepID=UPI00391748F2
MNDLHTRIKELDRATAYEASRLLAAELGADPVVKPIDHEVLADPMTHQDDLEDLAKVLLLATADLDPDAVNRAIDGAGHVQLVLGGFELIGLAILIVGGIQVVMSRGKITEHVETVVIERDSSGQEQMTTTNRTTRYGISGRVAGLLELLTQTPSGPP